MKQLHNKVNIVPVIAKADVLTKTEVQKLKKKVMEEIEKQGIKIYPLPDCDSDEDEDYKEQVRCCFYYLSFSHLVLFRPTLFRRSVRIAEQPPRVR